MKKYQEFLLWTYTTHHHTSTKSNLSIRIFECWRIFCLSSCEPFERYCGFFYAVEIRNSSTKRMITFFFPLVFVIWFVFETHSDTKSQWTALERQQNPSRLSIGYLVELRLIHDEKKERDDKKPQNITTGYEQNRTESIRHWMSFCVMNNGSAFSFNRLRDIRISIFWLSSLFFRIVFFDS